MKARTEQRGCYGNLFPDLTHLKRGKPEEGQAFRAVITGCGTGARGRGLEVKLGAWEECSRCPDYRGCYDLSVAKLLIHQVLMNTSIADPWAGG